MTLQEIDRRLTLLPEYLRYRIDYNSKYGATATWQRYKNTGVMFCGCFAEPFDEWYKNNKDIYFTLLS